MSAPDAIAPRSEYEDLAVDQDWTLGGIRAFAGRMEVYQGAAGVAGLLRKLVDLVIRLKRREQELLEANTHCVNRARDAEAALKESLRANGLLSMRLRESLKHIEDAA